MKRSVEKKISQTNLAYNPVPVVTVAKRAKTSKKLKKVKSKKDATQSVQ